MFSPGFTLSRISSSTPKSGNGVIIVDAGGGTVDLSAYSESSSAGQFQEIAAKECELRSVASSSQ